MFVTFMCDEVANTKRNTQQSLNVEEITRSGDFVEKA